MFVERRRSSAALQDLAEGQYGLEIREASWSAALLRRLCTVADLPCKRIYSPYRADANRRYTAFQFAPCGFRFGFSFLRLSPGPILRGLDDALFRVLGAAA